MILEGIVTSLSADGVVNIAPMGPAVELGNELTRFMLRPYRTATTYRNLKLVPEGVLHVTDDVLLLAKAAIGSVDPVPELFPAKSVRGFVLASACRWYEFRVARLDDIQERTTIECTIVNVGHLRDFFGFNRAKHAVVEAAILASRIGIIPIDQIEDEFRRLASPVQKTGGPAELEAFDYLDRYVRQAAKLRAVDRNEHSDHGER